MEVIAKRLCTVAVLESYSQPGLDIIDTDDASAIVALVARLAEAGQRVEESAALLEDDEATPSALGLTLRARCYLLLAGDAAVGHFQAD